MLSNRDILNIVETHNFRHIWSSIVFYSYCDAKYGLLFEMLHFTQSLKKYLFVRSVHSDAKLNTFLIFFYHAGVRHQTFFCSSHFIIAYIFPNSLKKFSVWVLELNRCVLACQGSLMVQNRLFSVLLSAILYITIVVKLE